MRNNILFLICIILFSLSYSVYGATGYGTPEIYRITISKVELYNSTTSSWVTVGEGELTFNIASVNAGEIVGSYVSSKSIPEGVYTKDRVTVSRTISIKSTGTIGATTYYTTATTVSGPDGTQAVLASTNSSDYGEGTLKSPETSQGEHYNVIGEYFTDTSTFSQPLVVKKGTTKKIRIKFDVTNAVTFDDTDGISGNGNDICYPNAPTVTVEVVD